MDKLEMQLVGLLAIIAALFIFVAYNGSDIDKELILKQKKECAAKGGIPVETGEPNVIACIDRKFLL